MRKRTTKKAGIGSAFDDFLKDAGTYEATQSVAIKRVLAWQIEKAMKKQRLTKAEMARRMETSRSQLDRLLDPDSDSVTAARTLQWRQTARSGTSHPSGRSSAGEREKHWRLAPPPAGQHAWRIDRHSIAR